jgi:hypothetical protein
VSGPVEIGRLVVVPVEPELGVGRVVDELGGQLRLLLYRDGTLVWRARDGVMPCPPNTKVAPADPD